MDASRRLACALLLASTTLLATPGGAAAHLRSGTVAVGFHVSVDASPAGVDARVYQSDRAVRAAVRAGHSLVVLGYVGEPMLRLDAAGSAVNLASPSAAAAGLVRPRDALRGRPVWRLERGRHAAVWHDVRIQGVADGVWTIPLVVDGRPGFLRGRIEVLPRPAAWPWAVLAVLVLGGAGTAYLAGRMRTAATAFAAVAGAAAVATAALFAIDAYASPGAWIAGADELVFAAVGFGALAWGTAQVRAAASIGLGLLAVAVAASKGAVLLHAQVLAAAPGDVARVSVVVAASAGLAAAVLGGVLYSRLS